MLPPPRAHTREEGWREGGGGREGRQGGEGVMGGRVSLSSHFPRPQSSFCLSSSVSGQACVPCQEFAGSITTLGWRCSVCSGSVSWAATALTGAFFVSAAQWQGLQHVCRVCGKGCSMFAGSVSDSMLLVQASLQACSMFAGMTQLAVM